jgi:hypothetical protein
MILKIPLCAAALTLASGSAFGQTRTYLIHFDGSCSGMTLHVTNGLNIVGNSVGCGDTKRAYVGTIGPGNVASVTSTGQKASVDDPSEVVKLNYVIRIRDKSWVLYRRWTARPSRSATAIGPSGGPR